MSSGNAPRIRPCRSDDSAALLSVINDAARAYRGVIPEDRWSDPYMTRAELEQARDDGVHFWCWEEAGSIVGVMGVQPVEDVTLIRHAYVVRERQGEGIGTALLEHLLDRVDRPVLVGTWAAAEWAIAFYKRHGFEVVPDPKGSRLLRRYWSIPERQVETSVVLADETWRRRCGPDGRSRDRVREDSKSPSTDPK